MVFELEPPPRATDIALTPELLTAAAKAVRICLGHVGPVLARGLAGAGLDADRLAIKASANNRSKIKRGRLCLHELAVDAAELAAASAVDHLYAFAADLTREPLPVLSHLTPVRAALEAGGLFGHLADRTDDVSLRLARIAGMWLVDCDSARKLATSHNSTTMIADAQATESSLHRMLDDAGVTWRRNGQGKPINVALDGQVVPRADIGVAAGTRKFLGPAAGAFDPYNSLSGGAHTRPWMHGGNRGTGAGSVLTAVWVAREVLARFLVLWGTYAGQDVGTESAKVRQALTGVLNRAAAGDFASSARA
ncbi:hypothetical protein [Kitasatospora sp. NPDC085879]|uniref:hypothetical protein n=1 Tax=Kitasatospora sp. NPDC085879 TaxID=3154769 RepID=UPI003415A90B